MATIENSYFLSLEKIKLSLEGKLNLIQNRGDFINDFQRIIKQLRLTVFKWRKVKKSETKKYILKQLQA